MEYFVIGADGQRYGPEPITVVSEWVREGRIIAGTTLIDAQSGASFRAADIPQLAHLFHVKQVPSARPAPRTEPYQPFGPATGPMPRPGAGPQRSRFIAFLLGFFLGGLGAHRFYLGYVKVGLLQLLVSLATCGYGAIWGVVESFICLAGGMNDADGQPLV